MVGGNGIMKFRIPKKCVAKQADRHVVYGSDELLSRAGFTAELSELGKEFL